MSTATLPVLVRLTADVVDLRDTCVTCSTPRSHYGCTDVSCRALDAD